MVFFRERERSRKGSEEVSLILSTWLSGSLELYKIYLFLGKLIYPNLVHIGFWMMYCYTKVFSSNYES